LRGEQTENGGVDGGEVRQQRRDLASFGGRLAPAREAVRLLARVLDGIGMGAEIGIEPAVSGLEQARGARRVGAQRMQAVDVAPLGEVGEVVGDEARQQREVAALDAARLERARRVLRERLAGVGLQEDRRELLLDAQEAHQARLALARIPCARLASAKRSPSSKVWSRSTRAARTGAFAHTVSMRSQT